MSDAAPAAGAAFGVFKVGRIEVAIPIADLQEVVSGPDPERVAASATMTHYVFGTFALRGAPVPTIDLRLLLGHGAPAGDADEQDGGTAGIAIVVIARAGGRLGLVVDGIGNVVRAAASELHDVGTVDRFPRLVQRLLVIEDGSRIIHVLDVEQLLAQPDVVLAAAAREGRGDRARLQQERALLLAFRCGELSMCFHGLAVQSVIVRPALEDAGGTSDYYRGVLMLRGRAIPVVDTLTVLGLGRLADEDARYLVVIEAGGQVVACLVSEVVTLFDRQGFAVSPLPAFGLERPELLEGMVTMPGGADALVLSHDALVRRGEIQSLSRLHLSLSHEVEARTETSKSGSMLRRFFLRFTAGTELLADLADVEEIIDLPGRFVAMPSTDGALLGILKRGPAVIALVSLPQLILPMAEPVPPRARVLLVRGERTLFGFVVDSVDAIRSALRAQALPRPAGEGRQAGRPVVQRCTGMVAIKDHEPGEVVAVVELCALARELEGASGGFSFDDEPLAIAA